MIPVFNHGRTVGDLVRRTLDEGVRTLVVDDGSRDGTAAVLAGLEREGIRELAAHGA